MSPYQEEANNQEMSDTIVTADTFVVGSWLVVGRHSLFVRMSRVYVGRSMCRTVLPHSPLSVPIAIYSTATSMIFALMSHEVE